MWKETGKINIIATGQIIELYEKEYEIDGKLKMFENARRPPGVRLLFEKVGKILLTKEYRSEHNGFDYRLPGGKVFDRIADMKQFTGDILDAAKNAAIIEAQEECGIVVDKKDLELFTTSHCGATIEWDLYYFIVQKFILTDIQALEEGEYITFDWYSEDEIIDLARNGSISEDRTKGVLWEYFLKNKESGV
ncbi:NUDIX domain-containing protein [Candidatus Gracilibacteria bacterium]|nr:NUDIX domain-containing protein [Candidatus Gracilibacteria bacterium]